jgi:hypothetical protein
MKKILLLLFCFTSYFCFSQEGMETDRPDQTECSSLVQPGSIQVETGIVYAQDDYKDQGSDFHLNFCNYGTTLIRIGVFNSAELRLELGEYQKTNLTVDKQNFSSEGFSPFVVGTKLKVCDESGIIPQIALLGHLELPFGDKKYISKNEILPSFRFSLAHTLSQKLSLGYNLGLEWKGGSAIPTYVYTLTISDDISNKLGVFIETFGGFAKSVYPESYFDFGLTFSPYKNLQLDTSGGFALNEASTDFFLSVGLSFRIPH